MLPTVPYQQLDNSADNMLELRTGYFKSQFVDAMAIGKGKFGRVTMVTSRQYQDKKYAIKIIAVQLGAGEADRTKFEVTVLKEVGLRIQEVHPTTNRFRDDDEDDGIRRCDGEVISHEEEDGKNFLMKYYDSWSEARLPYVENMKKFGPTEDFQFYLFLKCELYHPGRTLGSWIQDKNMEQTNRIVWGKKYVWQIAKGLAYLHKFKCLHRDLHPGNVVLVGPSREPADGGRMTVKIVDFGTARLEKDVACRGRGHPLFRSPEQLEKNKYGTPTDIFAVGLILYAILCPRRVDKDYLQEIKFFRDDFWKESDDFEYPPHFEGFEREKEIIKSLIRLKPERRPGAVDIEQEIRSWSVHD